MNPETIMVHPIPCAHIFDYYNHKANRDPCIAWNLLRRGYFQAMIGQVIIPENNLYNYRY